MKSIAYAECREKGNQEMVNNKGLIGFSIGIVLIVLVELNEMKQTHKGGNKEDENNK